MRFWPQGYKPVTNPLQTRYSAILVAVATVRYGFKETRYNAIHVTSFWNFRSTPMYLDSPDPVVPFVGNTRISTGKKSRRRVFSQLTVGHVLCSPSRTILDCETSLFAFFFLDFFGSVLLIWNALLIVSKKIYISKASFLLGCSSYFLRKKNHKGCILFRTSSLSGWSSYMGVPPSLF